MRDSTSIDFTSDFDCAAVNLLKRKEKRKEKGNGGLGFRVNPHRGLGMTLGKGKRWVGFRVNPHSGLGMTLGKGKRWVRVQG